jgi:hypothetical protein
VIVSASAEARKTAALAMSSGRLATYRIMPMNRRRPRLVGALVDADEAAEHRCIGITGQIDARIRCGANRRPWSSSA